MHKKVYLALALAGMVLTTVSACGGHRGRGSSVTEEGFPTTYAKEREQVLSIERSDENEILLTTSGGKLVEAISGDVYFSYYGDMKENKPDGYGIVYERNGSLLFGGEFKKGKPSGYGIVFNAYDSRNHPDVYEGEDCSLFTVGGLHKFQASGDGFIYDNISFLLGEPRIIYEGELDKNERDGNGREYYEEESGVGFGPLQYEGEFKKDKLSGDGTLYGEDGSVIYEGGFRKNSFHGKGTLYDEDGSVRYKGKFKNGEIKD